MSTSRNPAKSRPLSANVKRLMRLARASPQNNQVIKVARQFTARDLAYCHKQGNLFMEAASMGFTMADFAPLYMTSQLAGVFDVSFAAANGMENDELSNLLRVPMLLKSPEAIVEALYWIDDIISKAEDDQNKSLLISQALSLIHISCLQLSLSARTGHMIHCTSMILFLCSEAIPANRGLIFEAKSLSNAI